MGFPRLPAQRQGELIVSLLNSLESKPQAHQESLLLLVVQALQHVQWPSDPAKRQSMFYLSEKPTVKKLLIQTLLDVLLMPYGWATMPPVPPGLSEYTYKKILTDLGSSQSADYLEQLKLGIIKFLSNDALSDGEETLCPLIVGAADARFAVTNAAELQLRKIMGGIEWENATVLSPLFAVYMGSKEGTPDKHKEPASTRLRLKLLPYICKARKQAILWPISVRVLFDSLYGENTHVKLKAQALTFFSVIIQQVSASQLSVVANVLLTSGLMKLIAESDNEPSLKQQAYLTAGQLVTKVPALVKKDLSLLQTLFTVLCQEENNEVRMSVREALLTMASAFSVDSADQSLLLALLTTQVESPSPAARLVAVRYLATVCSPTPTPCHVFTCL
ncbi:proteasome adapter and scaffold protein ECM29-like [Homalodisca vitripennis]|uniref:proteasome adapter and scaffold protein ECM29-like n=1 Tax=Homalodisca vitripennis TaxID=197043 RepID=UPI001EE9F723|nr:proteasome adapter and scaffold protein ECM29-like [Homalodisca vitripennis]